MSKFIFSILLSIGVLFTSCSNSDSDSSVFQWGENLDFYDISFYGLADVNSLLDWSLWFGDETVQVNAYTADYFGEDSSSFIFANTSYTINNLDDNGREITVMYDSYDIYEVYSLHPSSESRGSYTYKGYLNNSLYRSTSGEYEVTMNGKVTDQYKEKYLDSGTGSDGDDNSVVLNCRPYTTMYEQDGRPFSDDRIETLNNDCSKACEAKDNNDQAGVTEQCGYLHYMLDYVEDYNVDNARTCPACQ